jgi:7,8-dihydroneopterin aldolase/epimerase/oxygenase
MDKILVHGIQMFSTIGVTAEERAKPQSLLADLTLELDLDAAANTDDLRLTTDYKALVERLQQVAQETSCQLLEALTARLCRAALQDPRVATVHLRLRKYPADMIGQAEYVAVEMTRSHR